MPRLLLVVIVVLVLIVAGLLGLAALDREVPQARVEQPVANAPAR